jgi:hypothetical protein
MNRDWKSLAITDRALDASVGYIAPSKKKIETSERFQFSLQPSQNAQSSLSGIQSVNTGGNSSQSQYNQYNPYQSGLQPALGAGYGNLLAGNVPTSFTQNPDLVGAYTTAFNQNAPSMAFQGGAGSPQMQSNYAMGLQQLLANQYNTGISNYMNALGGAGGYSLTPVGQIGQGGYSSNTQQGFQTRGTQNIQQPLGLLQTLLGGSPFGLQ